MLSGQESGWQADTLLALELSQHIFYYALLYLYRADKDKPLIKFRAQDEFILLLAAGP